MNFDLLTQDGHFPAAGAGISTPVVDFESLKSTHGLTAYENLT